MLPDRRLKEMAPCRVVPSPTACAPSLGTSARMRAEDPVLTRTMGEVEHDQDAGATVPAFLRVP
ncbi:hypothetical protein GCM10027075_15750 [Streptomyces heilongjiangensis]